MGRAESAEMSSINACSEESDPPVELTSMRTRSASRRGDMLQSTGFNSPPTSQNLVKKGPPKDLLGTPMEDSSDREELSSASTTSGSSLASEEHRSLIQSLILGSHDHYDSFSTSLCSDSEQSCSTLEDCSSYSSTNTEGSSLLFEEDYSDDGHYRLIQLPESRQDYWAVYESDSDEEYSSAAEIENSIYHQLNAVAEEKREFCVQCHAWPEVTDCSGRIIKHSYGVQVIIFFFYYKIHQVNSMKNVNIHKLVK